VIQRRSASAAGLRRGQCLRQTFRPAQCRSSGTSSSIADSNRTAADPLVNAGSPSFTDVTSNAVTATAPVPEQWPRCCRIGQLAICRISPLVIYRPRLLLRHCESTVSVRLLLAALFFSSAPLAGVARRPTAHPTSPPTQSALYHVTADPQRFHLTRSNAAAAKNSRMVFPDTKKKQLHLISKPGENQSINALVGQTPFERVRPPMKAIQQQGA